MSSLTDWTNETPERRRVYEQECLIVETTEEIYKAMEAAGLSKVALAERIGSSKSNVTQLMSGSRNMTVRTLADIAAALGCKVTIRLDRAAQETPAECGECDTKEHCKQPYGICVRATANRGESHER